MDYLVKAIIFVPFMALVYYVADYFLGLLGAYASSIPLASLLCQFGVFTGLNVFFSIIVSAFVAKQVLTFLK